MRHEVATTFVGSPRTKGEPELHYCPPVDRLRAPGRRASSGTGSRCRSLYRSACRGPFEHQDLRIVQVRIPKGQIVAEFEPARLVSVLIAALPGWV